MRALVAFSLALMLLAAAAAASSFAGAASTGVAATGKVDQKVLDQIADNGQTTFWAILREKADLTRAPGIQNRTTRGAFVVNELKRVAEQSQSGLRGLLLRRGAQFKQFFIINAIRITGGEALMREVAALPEVERIQATRTYKIPDPSQGRPERTINAVEWGIDRIRAPLVWSTFGDRGEGIVVANVDTGVQFNHPATVTQYRGNLGGGVFDHNYNWVDPSLVCGSPSAVPCDNNGHGTHTMGTMVGDDGATNQIGVAPGARWIAAKGCETNFCSDAALLASGQWVLAPTDLNGQNPRPDLRPHIANNSWGGGSGDTFYQATVDAWNASGIFPAFSNGNAGSSCSTSGSPGDFLNTYSAGAFDINNVIAGFSSRGPSVFGGELKPNIAAPGVNVRSSVPTDAYAAFNGTSMASPHVAATVALMWSAAPALIGDIPGTRALLDVTAIDTEDLQCGGTAEDNNVWGEGRLDAFAAVDQSPRGPTGTLSGTVTDGSNPIAGATLHAVSTDITPPVDRTTTTDANGNYLFTLPIGTYDVTASVFGFLTETATGVQVLDGQTTDLDFALDQAPSHSVSGTVRDGDGNPIANATVEILGTPIPAATTDASGFYSFPTVPEGTYDVRAEAGRCNESQTQALVVNGDETLDFTLPRRSDNFGYFCEVVPADYIEGDTPLGLVGLDAFIEVPLPFPFTFYGQTYETGHASTKAYVNFLAGNVIFENGSIPSTAVPNGAVYAFWDDLNVDGAASTWKATLGQAPNRRFVLEWRNVSFFQDTSRRVDAEIVLFENGHILTQYRNIADDGRERGNSATIGLENAAGDDAFQYSFNEAVVQSPEFAILWQLPPSGFIQGTVTDANDALAVSGATVKAIQNGTVVRQTTTNAAGFYRLQVPLGTYTVEASKTNYVTESAQVVVDDADEVVTRNFVLRTARAEVSPTSLEFIVPQGESRTKTLTLSNTGSADMTWEVLESGGGTATGQVQWLRTPPATGTAVQKNATGSGLAFPSAARWHPDTPSVLQPSILVYTDDPYHPSPNTYVDQALHALGLPYTAFYDANFPGFEAALAGGTWDVVVFADDNFIPPTSTLTALNNYVAGGGKLVVHSWTVGFNTSPLWAAVGAQWITDDNDPPDPVHWWQPDHPAFTDPESVPELTQLSSGRFGIYGQRVEPVAGFEALAGYTDAPAPNQAAMVLGNNNRTIFKGFTDGQNDADLDGDTTPDSAELWTNLISGIEQGFFSDVPWLSEDPTSGTLAPDESVDVEVTADTTGLAPGVYDARLTFRTNSGRQPNVTVPVRLIIPAYYQAVNAAGGPYTSLDGDLWAADKAYAVGSWGYLGQTNTTKTKTPIDLTADDPLYQDKRRGNMEYRFDGLPAGTYEIDLRFAELQNQRPNQRLFDVIAESNLLEPALDISALVGRNAALDRSYFIQITDGTLNLRFVPRQGFKEPVVNGIRIRERPDK